VAFLLSITNSFSTQWTGEIGRLKPIHSPTRYNLIMHIRDVLVPSRPMRSPTVCPVLSDDATVRAYDAGYYFLGIRCTIEHLTALLSSA